MVRFVFLSAALSSSVHSLLLLTHGDKGTVVFAELIFQHYASHPEHISSATANTLGCIMFGPD